MNKRELVEKLKKAEGLSTTAAELVVDTVLESMEAALVNGDRI